MKKLLLSFITAIFMVSTAQSKEIITISSYTGAAASVMAHLRNIVAEANSLQDQYEFVLVPKPGAQGLIALQQVDQSPENNLALISAGFVDLYSSGQIKQNDYIPVSSQGNTCWVLISNVGDTAKGVSSLRGQKRLTLGTIAIGSSAHFTGLVIGDRLGFEVEPIAFKTTIEALVLMAADGSINLAIDTPQNYLNFKEKNPNIQALGVNCSIRNPKLPHVKTLKEQGYDVPGIWTITVAHQKMSEDKRVRLGKILDQALTRIGKDQLAQNDYNVPLFQGVTAEQHYKQSISQIESVRQKFGKEIKK